MTYTDIFNSLSWDELKLQINSVSSTQVISALGKRILTFNDFIALLSPKATAFLETMAIKSSQITKQQFGNTIQLFIPLYLSNKCANICTYCGYSLSNKISRKTLTLDEVKLEADAIKAMGFDHILLVTGEAGNVGVDYFLKVLQVLKTKFSHISLESQPLTQLEYQKLHTAGLDAVLNYQETYNRFYYKKYHVYGKKSNFDYRLTTADRAGQANINKLGLGCLIGLSPDWRIEAAMLALHLDYLEKTYWKTSYAISFPRLRPAKDVKNDYNSITDAQLLQLICAFRIYKPTIDLSLSTRETMELRDNLLSLGISSMSAASKTTPGGYANNETTELEQFEIADRRSVFDTIAAIRSKGLEAIHKNWTAFTAYPKAPPHL